MSCCQRIEETEQELREKEKEVTVRDKVITELRLRMPATAERDEMILKARETATGKMPEDEDYESRQAVKVATETVAGLQVRLGVVHHDSVCGHFI